MEEETADGLGPHPEAIRPPRLEDAGLEDCALPPEAIQEAFFRAADSIHSRVISPDHEEEENDGCYFVDYPRVCDEGGSFPAGEEKEAIDDDAVAADAAAEVEGELCSSSDAAPVVPEEAREGVDLRRGEDKGRKNEGVIESNMTGEAPV